MFQNLSVNFHLWQDCNMACGYCFNHKHMVRPDPASQLHITKILCDAGFSKISFVGGEPTLCPWLPKLVELAKNAGVTTMLITNGKLLQKQKLPLFDWIGLSIDSFSNSSNRFIGRTHLKYFELCDMIKSSGCHLKINTVINQYNMTEDFTENIIAISPDRWKVFQVLKIIGQNDMKTNEYGISNAEFTHFINKHSELKNIMCPEYNSDMQNSYLMIDYAGHFVDNSTGQYINSQSILDVGVEKAFQQINFNLNKYINRKGIYNWRTA